MYIYEVWVDLVLEGMHLMEVLMVQVVVEAEEEDLEVMAVMDQLVELQVIMEQILSNMLEDLAEAEEDMEVMVVMVALQIILLAVM